MGACQQTSSLQPMRRKLVPTKNASTPSRNGENTAQYSDFGVMHFLEYTKHTNKWWEVGQASVKGVAMGVSKQTSSWKHMRRQLVPTKNVSTPSRSLANRAQYWNLWVLHLENRKHTKKWWKADEANVEGVAVGAGKQTNLSGMSYRRWISSTQTSAMIHLFTYWSSATMSEKHSTTIQWILFWT